MIIASGSLVLTSEYFKILIDKIHDEFIKKHGLKQLPKTFQLYGYGAFDENKPSLKSDFEALGSEFINGKYLYDKFRDFEKGKPLIKLNQYYKTIILLFLGYKDYGTFLAEHKPSEDEHEKQLTLLKSNDEDITYYYINYYFGEDNTILKGQSIISKNWKKIQHIFMYPLEDGTMREYYSHGNIKRQGDTLTIKTNTLSGDRYIDGASEIYYLGHRAPSNINYLIGTYCTFDLFTNTVAGRAILEKCESKQEMEQKSKDPNIPPYIAMEIRNKRIVNPSVVPRHALELSSNSPYASLYGKIPGTYNVTFDFADGFKEKLKFKILPSNYEIVTLTENVYIEKDRIELLNKGSVINFRFNFSGIIALERVNIYFKSYYLKNNSRNQEGVFSGIDNENRLVNGSLNVDFTEA
ncbi:MULTISPECIES: hypothetical protein [Maribacter]|uniref:Uncharacterized protein n=1 Tax=Maribacter aquivivus TaxID=228958 RepID=A0A1M6QQ46_9FLAO|nr:MULTISPECIES: hypothetical protein [Maribacter]SHK22220.1 hypothetical protein SAMN04488007_2421 [Maribacter aquivivus]|tara:strand:+ start:626 stop:1852 length:1227 start_codon:yes stop_codon:yes gene_type:complete